MHLRLLLTSLALAAGAIAQSDSLYLSSPFGSVTGGKTQDIKYATPDPSTPATIVLRQGDPNDLQTVAILTDSATGGSFKWHVSKELQAGTNYALQISQGNQVNYLGGITIEPGTAEYLASSIDVVAGYSPLPVYATGAVAAATGSLGGNATATTYNTPTLGPTSPPGGWRSDGEIEAGIPKGLGLVVALIAVIGGGGLL